MKVLIIEENKKEALKLKDELEMYRIKTKIVLNGVDAYKNLFTTPKSLQYDYIIIELGLPDENGIEIIKFIISKFTSKIIIFTNKNYNFYKDECEYDHYLEKNKNTIYDVVDIILNENMI